MSEAAFKGDIPTMERLVAKGALVNQHDQVTTRLVVLPTESMQNSMIEPHYILPHSTDMWTLSNG
eukprot:768188-Hanusia_phi.AAC.4